MKNIFLHLENCYGIPKFEATFNFDEKKKAYLIYAPNGVMKTSFANTLNDICSKADTRDCFYPERKTVRIVKFYDKNGKDLVKDDILVIQPYSQNYKSENVAILLADEKLKNQYESIHREIDEKMNIVFAHLYTISGKRKPENILTEDFGYSKIDTYSCLEKIYSDYYDGKCEDYSNIKYSKLFSLDAEKILNDEKVVKQLQSYIEQYEKLLLESKVFKAVFNHNNAEEVLNSLEKQGFFKAKHKVLLANEIISMDEKEFKRVIDAEKVRILDVELAGEFKKIDDILKSNTGTKALRDFIVENKQIIPELLNIAQFKQKIWVSYLLKDSSIFYEAVLNYKNNKKKLMEIIEKARTQTSKWNEIVLQFNERFSNMPFRLEVINKDDVVLKSELPSVVFRYKNRGEETTVEEKELISHLSNGEKKALYLLNILFEIQARKEMNIPTFLILDDVADSFDYRNKYAIIEYIKDIVDCGTFMPIILTHNFDFYRTVAGRVGIKATSNFVLKNEHEISLKHGQYFENVFSYWRDYVYSDDAIFVSSISFVRNLVEYIKGCDNETYKNLTSLLHYKKNKANGIMTTDEITNKNLADWFSSEWGRDSTKFTQDMGQSVINLIYKVADDIVKTKNNSIKIEDKIVLSIAIRQKAERYMIERINNDKLTDSITGIQTRALRDMIGFEKKSDDLAIQEIIERVLIITSENIHINSFMYEPIVDMSIEELIMLYSDVETLKCK